EEELKQPLPASPAQVTEALAEIRTNLSRLEDLVQDYLTLVRTSQLERTPHDLGAALLAWATEWQPLALRQSVLLRLEGLEEPGHRRCACEHALPRPPERRAECRGCHAARRHADAGRPGHGHPRPAPRARYREWDPGGATRRNVRGPVDDEAGRHRVRAPHCAVDFDRAR